LVDAADFEWLSAWRWRLTSRGYAVRGEGRRNVYLHRELLGLERGDGLEGDHRNGDPLDNRRENLRVVSHTGNQQNRHYGYGSSTHRGVCWHKARSKWEAHARLAGKRHYLGLFTDEQQAAAAAARFRAEHMPYSSQDQRAA